MIKFSQKHAQYAFRSKLKQKIAIKIEEKAIRKTEICKKQTQKTSRFQLKQAQRQATRKSSKKPATPQKNKPKFAEKTQGWQHWIHHDRGLTTFHTESEQPLVRFVSS